MSKHISWTAVFLLILAAESAMAQVPTKAPVTDQSSVPAASTPTQGPAKTPTTEKQSAPAGSPSVLEKTEEPAEEKPPVTAGSDNSPAAKGQQIPLDPGYVIGPQDVLDIDVWQEKEFSRVAPVRPDGKITLPLLNDIQAAGLTPTELASSIAKLLEKYVTSPQVTVIVGQINSRIIYMSGEINKAGAIPLLKNLTVLQAISMAGGPNQLANPKKIYVLRTENGKQVRYPFNYKEAIKGKDLNQNIFLKPGDTIVVP